MRHLIDIRDLTRDEILTLLARAQELRAGASPAPFRRPGLVTLAFFEPSTRTRIGFAAAAAAVGAPFVDVAEARFGEGMSAPETLEDTIRVVSAWSALLVLRHSSASAHAAAVARSQCPVINAGDGSREHPTQALVDLFAIQARLGRLEDLRVGLVGDLAGSRAAHSLLRALALFPPRELRLMAPASRALDRSWLEGFGASVVRELDALEPAGLDVLYVCGLPEGGQGQPRLDETARARFRLTPARLGGLPPAALVLCPLPRIDEIDAAVDGDTRAAYFEQSDGGVFVRTAVLERYCGRGAYA